MSYTRRLTNLDATWARGWTADAPSDLVTISALTGKAAPKRGDIAYVTSTTSYYLWMDDGSWFELTTAGGGATYDTVISNTETGGKNNWAPTGLSGNTLILWNGASDITPTGFASGVTGQIIGFKNTSTTFKGTFTHNSGSSSAGNKIFNSITSIGTSAAPGGIIKYQYDGTQWRLIAHTQGATIPISSPTFTADSGGTWTAGGVTYNYLLEGNLITVFFDFGGTGAMTVTGSPYTLIASQPYLTAPGLFRQLCGCNSAGTRVIGLAQVDGTANTILQIGRFDAATWGAGTGNAFGQFRFPIL